MPPAKKAAAKKKRASAKKRAAPRRGVTHADVRKIALALPGAEEGTSYGTPAWRVGGKLFARIHQSGDALVVMIDMDDREVAMQADPKVYFITDHYENYPAMLVNLNHVTKAALEEALADSWRRRAPKKWIAARDGG